MSYPCSFRVLKREGNFPRTLLINTVGFFVALISAYAGTIVARYISPSDAEWLAFIILSTEGTLILYGNYIHNRISKSKRAIQVKTPGFKEGIPLGVGLCFSNIAGGFSATVAMPPSFFIWGATISITAFGYLGICLGNIVGDGWMAKFLGQYASLVAGLLLIGAGVHQVL